MMSRNNIWGFWVGVGLIGLGGLFLIGQFLRMDVMHYLWPFFILAVGAAFFIGMVAGGRSLGALAVPGAVITTIGLILFFQNLFGLWATWAYAWSLIISGAGVGLMIFGSWSQMPDLRRVGRVVIGVGLALFFVFGLFFELGASLLGMHSRSGAFWALALILAGIYVIFGRTFFYRMGGPVSRSAVSFSTPSAVGTSGAVEQPAAYAASGPAQVYPAPISTNSQYGDAMQSAVSSNVTTGVRKLSFHALGDMTIIQGEREGLEIEASDIVKARIRSEVRGDTLDIRYEQDWLDWLNPRFWNINTIRYTLYVHDLEFVDAAGLGNLVIPDLSTSRFSVAHSGAGNVTIRRLVVQSLTVRQAGLGNIEIEGRADRQDIELSGTGSYHAARLESSAAAVRLSGLGSAVIMARETLDAHVSGTGSIEYYGSPRISQHVSGLGSVRRIG